jgi:lipid-binding SYLF domain-containing protein
MYRLKLAVLATLLLSFAGSALAAPEYAKTLKEFRQIKEVQPFFANSYGFAVFPTIGKGGFGVGVAHGKGQVYANGKVTGISKMTQVTVGLQLGGQAYSQIIFFQDQRAYREFTGDNFEFGAQATAVAVTAGAQAQSSTMGNTASANKNQAKAEYHKGMAVFVRAKGGLMYEASIGGQKYKFTALKKK